MSPPASGKTPPRSAPTNNGYCTGTLIAPNVVLTAGHCSEDIPNNVLVGTSSLQRPSEGEVIPVKQRIEYPSSQRNARTRARAGDTEADGRA
jgi:secreted trypsin-like serine protease